MHLHVKIRRGGGENSEEIFYEVEYDENDPYITELSEYLSTLSVENNPHTIKMKNENVKALNYIAWALQDNPDIQVHLDLSDLKISTIPMDCFYIEGSVPNLVEVTLPKTCKKIDEAAFYRLPNLHTVNLNEGLQEIAEWGISDCPSLKSIELPSTVKNLKTQAFWNCKNLETVQLNDGLQEIGKWAFESCISLKAVEIPGTIKTWGPSSFYNCINLESVILNEGITEIPNYTFCIWGTPESTGTNDRSYNEKLTKIVIPSSVKRIGTQAFRKCKALKDVTLNEGLEIIDGVAFNICAIEEIVFPSTITTLVKGEGITYPCEPVSNCENLKSIKFAGPNKYFKVGEDGCLYTADGKNLITYPNALENEEFTIPKNVNVCQRVFYHKTKLKKVIIEEGDEPITVGYECFTSCQKLEEIVIPSNVVEIGADLIKWAPKIKKVFMADTTSKWKKIKINGETETVDETISPEEDQFSSDPVANKDHFAKTDYMWKKIKSE